MTILFPRFPRALLPLCSALILGSAATIACAQAEQSIDAPSAVSAARARWASAIAAFSAADQTAQPATGGVLFVGSSSIRLWSRLPQDFSHVPVVINRGFGGSTMADCDHLVKDLVLKYRPSQVLVYAGDNDLAAGRTPAEVLESFKSFVRHVRSELPDTRIDYISIKPSPLRAALVPRMREANALVAAYSATVANTGYIDVFTPMTDAEGAPRPELYGPDRLHMNEAGYALWRKVIEVHVGAAQVARREPASLPRPTGVAGLQNRP
jgi:lysophospholipase L1-like esterase